jgi:hypothetical protein
LSLLALSLSRVNFVEFFEKIKPPVKLLIMFVGAATAVSGILLSVAEATKVNQKTNLRDFPHSITSYLKKNHPEGGNIFNRMRDGGYLLYHLSPDFKVYIDGRSNILYPLDFVTRFADLYSNQYGKPMIEEIERYNIEFAILPVEMGKLPVADNSHPLSVEFVSKEFILLSAGDDNFPLSSRVLYFPMCWQTTHQPALAAEYIKAKKILSDDSALVPMLRSLKELDDFSSPAGFFNSVNIGNLASRHQKRLLGYVALELNFDQHAFDFFQSIRTKETLDLLMMAHAAVNFQNYRDAEEIVLFASSETWAMLHKKTLSNDEQAIAVTLFETLKKHQVLASESEQQLAGLRHNLLQNFPSLQLPLSSVLPRASCDAIFSAVSVVKN